MIYVSQSHLGFSEIHMIGVLYILLMLLTKEIDVCQSS